VDLAVAKRRRHVEPRTVEVLTAPAAGHVHTATLDDDGNGRTDWAAGHFHFVEELEVRPECEGGHVHELSARRAT
jgi:hypothetical protein